MASKQTRRSISVRGTTYSLLRDFCAEHDRSMSDVVEELLSRIIDSADAKSAPKTVAPLIARAPAPKPVVKAEPDRAAVRVVALPPQPVPTPAPAPRAVMPAKPPVNVPERPTPIANAGRPAPTPATKVKGTERNDYRAIRF